MPCINSKLNGWTIWLITQKRKLILNVVYLSQKKKKTQEKVVGKKPQKDFKSQLLVN